MNKFEIRSINVEKTRIEYDYEITGEWKKYFSDTTKFFVEYSEDISGMPLGLAAVPLICNVIVLASIFHAKIIVPVLDKAFYDSIPQFMMGFTNMYPMINFQYEDAIICSLIEESPCSCEGNEGNEENTMAFFSGGVDAYTTLIRHEKENITLLTVCGADTWYYNQVGFQEIMRKNSIIAELHNLRLVTCISTLRNFINEEEIYAYIYPLIEDNFWHGFQHGIGMFGLAAGYVYLYKLKKIYFASSYSAKDEMKMTCGSDPSIDNFVSIGSARICHDGYELSRQDKVSQLCDYSTNTRKHINLRVCYSSAKGDNCCECEKCIRTMFGILSEGYNPKDFGFEAYDETNFYGRFLAILKKISNKPNNTLALYRDMKKRFNETYSEMQIPCEMKVFYNSELPDLITMFNSIGLQEDKLGLYEENNRSKTVFYNDTYFKNYISKNKDLYHEICRKTLNDSQKVERQKVDYWIGDYGFTLNAVNDLRINGKNITFNKRNNTIVLEGWAADFLHNRPLADLFVEINNRYYSLNYGKENLNLAKFFNNDLLAYIGFEEKFPLKLFSKSRRKKISFYMIGFDGTKSYKYPAIEYTINLE